MNDLNLALGSKVKQLRTSHNLTLADLGCILNFTSRMYCSQVESGSRGLTCAYVYKLANAFGVSLNWLFGLSDEPYDNEHLLRLEESLIHATVKIQDMDFEVLNTRAFPADYLSAETRQQNYSLACRANICFLMHNLSIGTILSYVEVYQLDDLPECNFLGYDVNGGKAIAIPDNFYYDTARARVYFDLLDKLVKNPNMKPVFELP